MVISDLIRVLPASETNSPEDIFASSASFLFPGDIRDSHGDPDTVIVFKSTRHGEIRLTVASPGLEQERQLFAHYLWNAGIHLAELIAESEDHCVRGKLVLELGAGVGLGGIISCLDGAEKVVISDYPSLPILDNLRKNVKENIPSELVSRISIEGHEWGNFDDDLSRTSRGLFTRILVADCLWIESQHRNLVHSLLFFLHAKDDSARIFVVAGFHTGRAKVARFFDVAIEEGLEIEEIYEMDANRSRRKWNKVKEKGTEDMNERRKLVVVSILRRRLGEV